MENSIRLIGQETEYALYFDPAPGVEHPGNQKLFATIKECIENRFPTTKTERYDFQQQFFVINGGSYNYESHPFHKEDGLIEGGTPECQSAEELLLYQKASEKILLQATQKAEVKLRLSGISGRFRLIKNCRDAYGHLYGAQENYDLHIGNSSLSRWGILFSIAAFGVYFVPHLLLLVACTLGFLLLLLMTSTLAFCLWIVLGLLSIFHRGLRVWMGAYWMHFSYQMDKSIDLCTGAINTIEGYVFVPLQSLFMFPACMIFRHIYFQPYRKQALSFFCSRIMYSGAGCLLEDGRFVLAEKAVGTKRLYRWNVGAEQRPIFDDGNLLKKIMLGLIGVFSRQGNHLRSLFRPIQRFQLGMSDSNMAHFAEYLKIGTTRLVLRMAEEGMLHDAPMLVTPIASLHIINSDISLEAKVACTDGEMRSALEIQHWFWNRAKSFLEAQSVASLEEKEIVRLWGECLDILQEDPKILFGKIDWITKHQIIESAAGDLSYEDRKRIDLQYHELGTGFYAQFEAEGLTHSIIEEEAIDEAMSSPSSPEKVQLRAKWIQLGHDKGMDVTIDWDNVYLGSWSEREVVDLNAYRLR